MRQYSTVSTIDAARSGVAEMVVLSPEQREELSLVETQIKQKLAIGRDTLILGHFSAPPYISSLALACVA